MQKSDSIANLAGAILEVQKVLKSPKFDATNEFIGNEYVSLYALQEYLRPILNEHNLIHMQFPRVGGVVNNIIIHAPSGEWISDEGGVDPKSNDPQSVGSAISYSKRYGIFGIWFLSGRSDDDDASAAMGAPAKAAPKPVMTAVEGGYEFRSTVENVVERKVGANKTTTVWDVDFSNGVKAGTFHQPTAAFAIDMEKQKGEVTCRVEEGRFGYKIFSLEESLPF